MHKRHTVHNPLTKSLSSITLLVLAISLTLFLSCTTPPSDNTLTILTKDNISASFDGFTLADVGGEVTLTGTNILITGFRNPPDTFDVTGSIDITPPAGYTATPSSTLPFPDITGTASGSHTDLDFTVTVSATDETVTASLTYSIEVEFLDGTPTLMVSNQPGFEEEPDDNAITLNLPTTPPTAQTVTVSPCSFYSPDVTFMLGSITASENYVVALASATPQADSYHDGATAANNTNTQTYQVTNNSQTLTVQSFDVVIKECEVVFSSRTGVNLTGGTIDNPWELSDAIDLQLLAFAVNQALTSVMYSDDYYELTASIDLNEVGGRRGFVPIGVPEYSGSGVGGNDRSFIGHLDCKGMTIANLSINRSGEDFQALFGQIGKPGSANNTPLEIKNCRFENVNITGRDGVAAVAGVTHGKVTFENIFVSGKIEGRDNIGAIVGDSEVCTSDSLVISNVGANVGMKGQYYVGGLVGYTCAIKVNSSFFRGTVEGISAVGGILGYSETADQVTLSDIYVRGTVTGEYRTGGLAGSIVKDTPYFTNSSVIATVTEDIQKTSYSIVEAGQPFEGRLPPILAGDSIGVFIGTVVRGGAGDLSDNSYADETLNTILVDDDGNIIRNEVGGNGRGVAAFTTTELQAPTEAGAAADQPYNTWSATIWNFGTSSQYPVIEPDTTYGVFTLADQRPTSTP